MHLDKNFLISYSLPVPARLRLSRQNCLSGWQAGGQAGLLDILP
jgi:hypothetical protein